MNPKSNRELLDTCRDYNEVFTLVKRAVKKNLGKERSGLMLYLGNLPLNIGAFHGVGSNSIVLNKRLLKSLSVETITELNSYVFMLLLHEYLHSLGYLSEKYVQNLVFEICNDNFGADHPTTIFAKSPRIPAMPEQMPEPEDVELEIIRNFEQPNSHYIS